MDGEKTRKRGRSGSTGSTSDGPPESKERKQSPHTRKRDISSTSPSNTTNTKKSKRMLIDVIKIGDVEEAKQLIESGENVNDSDEEGNTPLMIAIFYENKELVKFLLNNNAKIMQENNEGLNALIVAAYTNNISIAKKLLKECDKTIRYDYWHKDNEGNSAFSIASQMGHHEITRLLIKYASNPNRDKIFWPERGSGPSRFYKGGKSRKRKPCSK